MYVCMYEMNDEGRTNDEGARQAGFKRIHLFKL